MSKRAEKNVIENGKYRNILTVLDAYPDGLELMQLACALIDVKKLIKKQPKKKGIKNIRTRYLNKATAEGIKYFLNSPKYKKKNYTLSGALPTSGPDIYKHLTFLRNHGLVDVVKRGKTTIYKPAPIAGAILMIKPGVDPYKFIHEAISPIGETKGKLLHVSKIKSDYMSSEFYTIYEKSEVVKNRIKSINEKMKNLMDELYELSKEAREEWKKNNLCSYLLESKLRPQIITVMMYFPLFYPDASLPDVFFISPKSHKVKED